VSLNRQNCEPYSWQIEGRTPGEVPANLTVLIEQKADLDASADLSAPTAARRPYGQGGERKQGEQKTPIHSQV
jgi:hypothetical protein